METPWPWLNVLLQACLALAAVAGAVTACYVLWEKVVKPVRTKAGEAVEDISARRRKERERRDHDQRVRAFMEHMYRELSPNGGGSLIDKVNRLVDGLARLERLSGDAAMQASQARQLSQENRVDLLRHLEDAHEREIALRAALQASLEAGS